MPTNIPYGADQALVVQGAGLFTASMARLTKLNRLTGKLPTQADAESNLRFQSKASLPVVRAMDLSKGPGDEIKFDLLNPVTGKPIMGDAIAQGLGKNLTFSGDKLHINQARFPISAGGKMSQQRTKYQIRSLAREQSFNLMSRYEDQLQHVHLAGARGLLDPQRGPAALAGSLARWHAAICRSRCAGIGVLATLETDRAEILRPRGQGPRPDRVAATRAVLGRPQHFQFDHYESVQA